MCIDESKEDSRWFILIVDLLALSVLMVFLTIFYFIYQSPTKSLTIYIDKAAEANIELIALIIIFLLMLISIFFQSTRVYNGSTYERLSLGLLIFITLGLIGLIIWIWPIVQKVIFNVI